MFVKNYHEFVKKQHFRQSATFVMAFQVPPPDFTRLHL
jgi:hypothetical protein